MSSFDHGTPISRRAGVRGIVFALAAWALAACTVQPVYAPTATGAGLQSTLARVVVEPVKERVAQQVRNELIFGLTGGASVQDPLYRIKLTVTSKEVGLGINSVDASPVYSVQVAATYEVVAIATGQTVTRSTARASASYSRSNQAFANSRAKIDAENSAAATVAKEITVRVAAAAAKIS
jgi:LPS-assembly lipoprotein